MKVLMLSHLYPSAFDETAGIFVHEQAKTLIEKGIEIKMISPVPWAPFPIKYLKAKWKAYHQIPYRDDWEEIDVYYPRYLEFPKTLFLSSSGWRMHQGIKDLVNKLHHEFPFDLIHAHQALPDGYAGMLLARNFCKPLVVTIHGRDFNYIIFKNHKCRQAIQQVINASVKTITVSHKLKRVADKHLTNTNRISVINNGINPGDLFRGSSPLVEKWRGRKIILSVSYLLQTKGVDLNIKAIGQLVKKSQNLLYIIVGDGPLRRKLERLVSDLDLKKWVEFVGQQSHDKVMEYMSICDVFSLPSWKEGFGVVYLEAMAHGKPIIGCRREGIEDLVEDKNTGFLVEPRDVSSLIEATDFLLSHPDKARAIGERARKFILENYTWERNAEKTTKLYEEILNER